MSKRDDDPSIGANGNGDMEAGMTTAERRRRRRGRGGLRVPSDNVPRRTTTPPVVAPVPEDPSLAMSIAYSFTSDGSEPVARVDVPSFGDPSAPEAMQTVIDPPSQAVESADFEMKTREMSAVDLDALGLAEHMSPSSGPKPTPGLMDANDLQARIRGQVRQTRSATEPTLDANLPSEPPPKPVQLPPTVVRTQPMPTMRAATEPSITEPPTRQMRAATDPGALPPQPTPPQPRERLRTMALSDDDLLEVREAAARALTATPRAETGGVTPPSMIAPPPKLSTTSTQPLSALDVEIAGEEDKPEPISVSDIDINDLADRAESSGEFDVDIDEQEPLKAVPQVASVTPPPAVPSADRRSRPPSVPPPPHTVSTTNPPPVAHAVHAPPPPPPAAHAHKAPPAPPPKARAAVAAVTPIAKPEAKTPRGKPWFVDLFDEDYLRTLPFLTPQATQSEAEFVIDAMGLQPGAQVLDIGCGYGRHAMELAARGFHVVGLDLSTPLLVRGGEEAMRRGLEINFVRGDMRELDFESQFDAAYCMFSTFGYFDDETNKKTITNIARALKPGGRMMLEILNRDYVIADLPTRVWWEGDGCVVLEEVELNYFSSRIQVNRSVVFDDGRQLEQEISVRAYSLHEVGKLMHAAGFRVLEVSGGYHTRGRFFGNQSRHIIVLAERKDPASG